MKVPFYLVEVELKKIYKGFRAKDPKEIEEICNTAIIYVVACGWTIDDYILRIFGEEKQNSKLN